MNLAAESTIIMEKGQKRRPERRLDNIFSIVCHHTQRRVPAGHSPIFSTPSINLESSPGDLCSVVLVHYSERNFLLVSGYRAQRM